MSQSSGERRIQNQTFLRGHQPEEVPLPHAQPSRSLLLVARESLGGQSLYFMEGGPSLTQGSDEKGVTLRCTADGTASSIPNYGERYRAGETISSSFVESAVNQVVSKRMVKKQQMRWSPRGAHLFLQVRTRVLNDDLAKDFHRWYPGFTHTIPDQEELVAAA